MPSNVDTVLRDIVAQIESAEAEKADLADRITAHYAELKAEGFNPKIVRKLVALRKMDPAIRREQVSMLALYSRALGETEDLT